MTTLDNRLLASVIERETVREILETMTDDQRAVAMLRLVGLADCHIARLLGISRTAVNMRMRSALRRIARERPDLAPAVLGRRRLGRPGRRSDCSLDWSWICGELFDS